MSFYLKNRYRSLFLIGGINYIFSAQIASAACASPDEYELIAPIGTLQGCVNLTGYLDGLMTTIIGIAGVLAVIMIVICGIQLMTVGSASGKSAAKECITNAIFGVLLAISAYLILNTINPLLLKKTTTLPTITTPVTPAPTGPITEPMPTKPGWYYRYKDAQGNIRNSHVFTTASECVARQKNEAANGSVIQNGPNGTLGCFEVREVPQPAGEVATRNLICGNDSCINSSNSSVFVNNNSCNPPNADGVRNHCTNVNGIPASTISFIKNLTSCCGKIIITGGTEEGHTTHAQNQPIFDLRKDTTLVNFIKTNGVGPNRSFCRTSTGTCYQKWLYGGYWFTDEGDHFHVCQDGTTTAIPTKINAFKKACTKI